MKQNKQPQVGGTGTRALTDLTEAELDLADLLEVQQAVQAIDEKLKS